MEENTNLIMADNICLEYAKISLKTPESIKTRHSCIIENFAANKNY